MAGINKVILVGRLGKDPEVRYTPDGKAIANITLATSESWKDKNTGQRQEKTEWHRVVFFGGVAGVVGEYVRKGSQIYIEGKLQTRKWQDQSGQDRYTTEVVVDGFSGVMQMLDTRATSGDTAFNQNPGAQQQAPQQNFQQNQPQQQPQQAPQQNYNQAPQGQAPQQSPAAAPFDDMDDDIPF